MTFSFMEVEKKLIFLNKKEIVFKVGQIVAMFRHEIQRLINFCRLRTISKVKQTRLYALHNSLKKLRRVQFD